MSINALRVKLIFSYHLRRPASKIVNMKLGVGVMIVCCMTLQDV